MKYALTFVALLCGYLAACGFFFVQVEDLGKSPFRVELLWAAIYGFPFGFLFFFPCFNRISNESFFWRIYIAPIVGAVVGWASLALFLSELAMSFVYGGFACVMGFTTFFLGAIFHNLSRRCGRS
jgi:hypothetical protein